MSAARNFTVGGSTVGFSSSARTGGHRLGRVLPRKPATPPEQVCHSVPTPPMDFDTRLGNYAAQNALHGPRGARPDGLTPRQYKRLCKKDAREFSELTETTRSHR